uniref:Uncharacterized protein n=1 Tax=viral metagenome TaxID=1070528 RepID=A0A6H1ZZA0_9ZZZZ
MKLIEKIFYYGGCLAYGFTYFTKVAVKKAIEETLSQLPPKIEQKSIYEEENEPCITENGLKDIECINCHEKELRIEQVKCKRCGFTGKLPSLYRYNK